MSNDELYSLILKIKEDLIYSNCRNALEKMDTLETEVIKRTVKEENRKQIIERLYK